MIVTKHNNVINTFYGDHNTELVWYDGKKLHALYSLVYYFSKANCYVPQANSLEYNQVDYI